MSNDQMAYTDLEGMNFQIKPYEETTPLAMMPGYRKLDIAQSQAGQITAMFQQIPAFMAAETMSGAYIVKWPDGIQRELSKFADGAGFMGMSRNHGKIEQYAHLYSLDAQAALTAGFAALSLVTSQYYLAEMNQHMRQLNQGIDQILEFLYGEKRAELMAEAHFVHYAQQNYISIMRHPEQRLATIASLQEARKIAVKDLEFYMEELDSKVCPANHTDPALLVEQVMRTKDCLELSMQLYLMSSLMEISCTQNYDPEYLRYIDTDVSDFISKYEKHMLSNFNKLHTYIEMYKDKIGKKTDKQMLLKQVETELEIFNGIGESDLKKALKTALYSCEQAQEYCVSKDGSVYLKTA